MKCAEDAKLPLDVAEYVDGVLAVLRQEADCPDHKDRLAVLVLPPGDRGVVEELKTGRVPPGRSTTRFPTT